MPPLPTTPLPTPHPGHSDGMGTSMNHISVLPSPILPPTPARHCREYLSPRQVTIWVLWLGGWWMEAHSLAHTRRPHLPCCGCHMFSFPSLVASYRVVCAWVAVHLFCPPFAGPGATTCAHHLPAIHAHSHFTVHTALTNIGVMGPRLPGRLCAFCPLQATTGYLPLLLSYLLPPPSFTATPAHNFSQRFCARTTRYCEWRAAATRVAFVPSHL